MIMIQRILSNNFLSTAFDNILKACLDTVLIMKYVYMKKRGFNAS